MKFNIYTLLAVLIITASTFAQAPEKMSYQAVIRDAGNVLVSNQTVGMQISILQGSTSGTAVYAETQTPTTNANGLVSIEIGSGSAVSGSISAINWSAGPYFIKTETDPTGGTNYTITGTSELLSVPYALHANTADNITGTITETDPIFGTSVASGITGTDTTNWNNKLDSETDPVFTAWDKDYADLINTPGAADGSETQVTAGTNVTVTGSGTTASPYVVNATGGATLAIGDFYQGGIIFWLDATGQHGLVCAKVDQTTGIKWRGGFNNYNTMAQGDGPYAGKMNTSIIISVHAAKNDFDSHAALICSQLKVVEGGKAYGDWYLPSREELILMYNNKATIDATALSNSGSGFASAFYWSSSEVNTSLAVVRDFGNGVLTNSSKSTTNRVRAVRAF